MYRAIRYRLENIINIFYLCILCSRYRNSRTGTNRRLAAHQKRKYNSSKDRTLHCSLDTSLFLYKKKVLITGGLKGLSTFQKSPSLDTLMFSGGKMSTKVKRKVTHKSLYFRSEVFFYHIKK